MQARYLTQIASALRAEARAIDGDDQHSSENSHGQSLHVRAAESALALSKLDKLDLYRAADAMEAAADDLERAGETDRMIDVLVLSTLA